MQGQLCSVIATAVSREGGQCVWRAYFSHPWPDPIHLDPDVREMSAPGIFTLSRFADIGDTVGHKRIT